MTQRRPGMDHDLYAYSPLPKRPKLHWPQGSRLAACIVLHFEHWELDPPAESVRDMRFSDLSGYYFPDYRTYTWREYGNRVGIFRILDLLDRLRLPATVAANASACERYPFLVEAFRSRGYEFAVHGTHATRMISSRMSEDEERATIRTPIDAVARASGHAPIGWFGPDFGESARTPLLLAEAGLSYVADWPNDDQPYSMTVGRPFISIPNQSEWDDVQLLWHRRVPTARYATLVRDAFTRLHQEGAESGRFFSLNIHPWLMGMPHRIGQLEAALEALAPVQDVWWTTAGAVCEHMLGLSGTEGSAPCA